MSPHRASSLLRIPSTFRPFSSCQSSCVWVQKRIKVQLRSDHPVYGSKGQVIEVKPGHMRQQLYPAGHALYCARDGIPMHHLQPEPRPDSKVPPPGLSRPINELLQRLGIGQEFTENEIQAAQTQIDRWKRSCKNLPSSPSTSNSQNSSLD